MGFPFEIQESDFENSGVVVKGGIELSMFRDKSYALFRVTLDKSNALPTYILDPAQYPTSYYYLGTNAQNLPVF